MFLLIEGRDALICRYNIVRYWTKRASNWYVVHFANDDSIDEMKLSSLTEKICQKLNVSPI
jgi:hypothetical protein